MPTDVEIDLRQTDDEAELIGWLHEAVDRRLPVILNPAAFTHYSYALRDAAAQLTQAGCRSIEVHLTNPHARETFRHTSVISGVATGVIAGFGFDSYRLAVDWVLRSLGVESPLHSISRTRTRCVPLRLSLRIDRNHHPHGKHR